MNRCCNTNCDTVQLIEPRQDVLVESAATTNDVTEEGVAVLTPGQTQMDVTFIVPKISAGYAFEYLYISDPGGMFPGAIQIVVTAQSRFGFTLLLAGTPIEEGYLLHWRVLYRQSVISELIDAPEDIYLQLPHQRIFQIVFHNPRSGTDYGFSELRVENLVDPPDTQAIIGVQVYAKSTAAFSVAINPMPPSANYFLRIRTP